MSPPGGPKLTLRPLDTNDVAAISRIHYRACLIAYSFFNWFYPLAQIERWYAGKLSEWTWTLAACAADGSLVGFIAMIENHVDQLYIDPSHQRAGAGSLLLGAALKAAPGRITLNVFEGNAPARVFYEKHGFQARDRWMNEQEGAIDLLYVRG